MRLQRSPTLDNLESQNLNKPKRGARSPSLLTSVNRPFSLLLAAPRANREQNKEYHHNHNGHKNLHRSRDTENNRFETVPRRPFLFGPQAATLNHHSGKNPHAVWINNNSELEFASRVTALADQQVGQAVS